MDTASLRTLSPKTMAYKSWSTFIVWNNARVHTGSVADIKDPKENLEIKLREIRTLKPSDGYTDIVLTILKIYTDIVRQRGLL